MRTKNDDGTPGPSPPVTAETIIKDFLFEADMAFIEDNLHELLMEFVASESGCERTDKDDILYTYESLRRLIRNVKQIETKIRPR